MPMMVEMGVIFCYLGGEAKGEDFYDDGGRVSIEGGTSLVGYGGSLEFISGQSTEASSGDIRTFTSTQLL